MTLSRRISLFLMDHAGCITGVGSPAEGPIALADAIDGPADIPIVSADTTVKLKYLSITSANDIAFPADDLNASEITLTSQAKAPVSLADLPLSSANDIIIREMASVGSAEGIVELEKGPIASAEASIG